MVIFQGYGVDVPHALDPRVYFVLKSEYVYEEQNIPLPPPPPPPRTHTTRNHPLLRPATLWIRPLCALFCRVQCRYALGLFLWRDSMIRNKAAGPYDDKKGPILLVVTLSVVLIITLWYTSITSLPGHKVLPNPRDFNLGFKTSAGVCDQLLANRADLLQTGAASPAALRKPQSDAVFSGLVVPPLYRPNFVVAHTGLSKVLVGSDDTLTVMDATAPSTSTQLQLSGEESRLALGFGNLVVVGPEVTCCDHHFIVFKVPLCPPSALVCAAGVLVQGVASAAAVSQGTSDTMLLCTDSGSLSELHLESLALGRTWDLSAVLGNGPCEGLVWAPDAEVRLRRGSAAL